MLRSADVFRTVQIDCVECTHVTSREKLVGGTHAIRAMGSARGEFYVDTHSNPC